MGKKVNFQELKDILAASIYDASEGVKGIDFKKILPVKHILATLGLGIGGGALYAGVRDKINKNEGGARRRRNIAMYRDIESPLAGEEDAIDRNIYKNSSLAVDVPIALGSLGIPALVVAQDIKDAHQKKKLKKQRRDVGMLRDMVNDAYRQDMMEAYGIPDEQTLNSAVQELRNRVAEKNPGLLDKTSSISTPAALAAGSSLAFAGFLGSKIHADANDPRRRQQKEYLKQLDKLYRSRLNSPTVRQLPFSDEELLAMELYKQEKKGSKPAKKLTAPKSEGTKAVLESAPESDFEGSDEHGAGNSVDIDNPDIQNILKEL